MSTPFFPQWSNDLNRHARKFSQLAGASLHQLQILCGAWIPIHRLSQEDQEDFSRVRLWPFHLTFWTFLWQVTQAGSSCRDAVRQAAALCRSQNRTVPADETNAYCMARAKMPIERLESIHSDLLQDARDLIVEGDLWRGHRVSVVDATCFTMPDTPENQEVFPQQSVQKPGCGFPIARLLAFFCLSTGMITHWVTGNWHVQELALLPTLLECFCLGDVLLGDRGFGNYPVLAQCLRRGIHAVFRANTAKRKIDFRQGKRLGHNDRLVQWKKGTLRSSYLTVGQWDLLPGVIEVRVVKVHARVRGFRTQTVILVTTLLDPVKYPPQELAKLYLRRWNMELSFRHLKCTLQMDQLSCKTPAMVEREMRMHLLAHNIVRRMSLEASRRHMVALDRISFAGTLGVLHAYGDALLRAPTLKRRRQMEKDMYRLIAEDPVPLRPGRREPRAVKRRPKPYPLLTCHRNNYKDIPHRGRYRRPIHPNLSCH